MMAIRAMAVAAKRARAKPILSMSSSMVFPILRSSGATIVPPTVPELHFPTNNHRSQQTRSTMTKTKKRRLKKKALKAKMAERGIEPRKPKNFIPRDTPIINARSREEIERESREFDKRASAEMKTKIQSQGEILRFSFTGLSMSDRVKKLFDLTNGNQSEVIKAQKKRGMELFQMREGDTGSSAVQVIALTTRIQQLQTHLQTHRKDKSTKRGLDALYVRRRKVLDYMERKDFDSYRRVVKTLGLIR